MSGAPSSDRPAKQKVVLFSGGRGTANISRALAAHSEIELTIVVNAYDDGLSTGRIRRFVPGMLGPSDVRKTVARLASSASPSGPALEALLEHRLPASLPADRALRALSDLARRFYTEELPALSAHFDAVPVSAARTFASWLEALLVHADRAPEPGFDFADCAVGNLLLAGCFLAQGRSFNDAVAAFTEACGVPGRVLNVTRGENLTLVGVRDDGKLLACEADIVAPQNAGDIEEIFLLPAPLDEEEAARVAALAKDEALALLRERAVTPRLGAEAERALVEADVIIYGPGTQHSSLLPSYLSEGLGELIAANRRAEKVFISNILKDVEIQGETATSLVDKLVFYLSRKGAVPLVGRDVLTMFFFQRSDRAAEPDADYVRFDPQRFPFPLERVVLADWEAAEGRHLGGRVLDELLRVVNNRLGQNLRRYPYQVSIVVPALNEEKTVAGVLHRLALLDFQSLGLGKEILFVDGGSTDRTVELASRVGGVKVVSLEGPDRGRGAALREGVRRASGNIIAFFPSDGEYNEEQLQTLIAPIVSGEFPVVFGSRAVKVVDLSAHIRDIYRGQSMAYLISKYGGMSLSIANLLLYNRYVSDPLTGMKAFDGALLKSLELESPGLELELELLAKLGARRTFILEVPVDYWPRTAAEGKKTTVRGGLKGLWALVRHRVGS